MDDDIIVDVIADRRVLNPQEIPQAVAVVVETLVSTGVGPESVEHNGVRYQLCVRPCVYP